MSPRLLAGLLLFPTAAALAALDLPKRSLSSSRQFVIYTNDPDLRSKVAIRAEDLKTAFLETLRIKDEWKLPIILNIGSTPPNVKRPPRSQLGIYEGEDGRNKIQLDVFDMAFVKDPAFDTQILAAVLLETAHRKTPIQAGRDFDRPPAWALDGLAERIRAREDDSSAGIYATLLSGAEPPRLAEFLAVPPERLDATSRALYRAQAAALLDAVLALPDGRAGLAAYLSAPHRAPAQLGEITASFPSLGKDAAPLSRKWVLAIARASAGNRVDLLSERETARELDRLLAVKALPDPKRPEVASMAGPYAIPTIARSQNGRFILAQLESGLLLLSLRAHPLYKSLVDEYLRITRELVAKPKRREDKRIAAAEEMRAGLSRRTGESRDYVDWVETTKIKTESPELNQTMQDIDDLEAPPPRNDAISRYLDAVSERGF